MPSNGDGRGTSSDEERAPDREVKGATDDERSLAPTYRFAMPPNLTEGGRKAFARELGDELERQAVESHAHDSEPEHTAEAVERSRAAYQRRLQMDAIETVVKGRNESRWVDRSALAAILITIAGVAVPVMGNFLHSVLQDLVFGAFVVMGVTGLVLMWVTRRRKGPASPV